MRACTRAESKPCSNPYTIELSPDWAAQPSEALTSLTSPSPSALWGAAAHERQDTLYESPTCSPHQRRSLSAALPSAPAELQPDPLVTYASHGQAAASPTRPLGESPVPVGSLQAGGEAPVGYQSPYQGLQQAAGGVPAGVVVYESPVQGVSGGPAGAVLYESPQRTISGGTSHAFHADLQQLQSSAPEWPASYMSPAEVRFLHSGPLRKVLWEHQLGMYRRRVWQAACTQQAHACTRVKAYTRSIGLQL